jgi:hypothetical protein
MSRWNWRNGFAVGLVLGLSLSAFFVVGVASYGPGGQAPDAVGHEASQRDRASDQGEDVDRGGWWHWDGGLVSSRDTLAQWIMTAFTVIAAGLLFGTLRIARDTLLATQGMARDASRIGEAQVRGYVSVAQVKVKCIPTQESVSWVVLITLANAGQSPARDLTMTPQNFNSETQGNSIIVGDLAAGESREEVMHLSSGEDEIRFVEGSDVDVAFSLKLRVSFSDVFGQVHDREDTFSGTLALVNSEPVSLRRARTVNVRAVFGRTVGGKRK